MIWFSFVFIISTIHLFSFVLIIIIILLFVCFQEENKILILPNETNVWKNTSIQDYRSLFGLKSKIKVLYFSYIRFLTKENININI